MQNTIKRTTLIVRDVEDAALFYREVLDFSVYYDDRIVLGGVGLAAGAKGDETRLVILRAQDPQVGMLGLLQFTRPALPPPPGPRTRLGIGDVVFVLQTDDVAEVHRRLLARGARIHAAPHEFRVRGADGIELTMRSLSFWDTDGYFLEINERLAL
jgi:catechol 2,3-dioxygenase-like lactoylglutathione lyase family enzyme